MEQCCRFSKWIPERDLDSASGFDFTLVKCSRCGKPWLSVFCTASSMSGYEPVTPEDAGSIRAIADPYELKAFMKRWAEKNI